MKQSKKNNTWQKQQQKKQKIFWLFMSLLLVLSLFIVIAVPVSYVPLFNGIASKFGLSNDIARKLTLVDLALSSLGVETKNMKDTFKKTDISDEPAVFLASRYKEEGKRLLDAREMYYNEYEYTRRRPDEIAGIYQDGREVDVPEIDKQSTGIRAVPEEDFLSENSTFSSYGNARSQALYGGGSAQSGQNTRKVRQSVDKDGVKEKAEQEINKALPDFANNIYEKPSSKPYTGEQAKSDVIDLNNSRMIKPVLKGETFSVSPKSGPVGDFASSVYSSNMFGLSSAFGGHEALGYYISDDIPKVQGRLLDYYYFGRAGFEAAGSYFYSYAATSRRYKESAKYLAEVSFSGDEAEKKILIAPGQTADNVVRVSNEDSPFEIMAGVKGNMKGCENARKNYKNKTKDFQR